ncbi:MAG: BMP family ABC transporter substrate-binding protein [Lachnospiraceae bacterium]|nr:BMP family ABC transporter substrate-binding protein [Lachnospiraceae bacterium]
MKKLLALMLAACMVISLAACSSSSSSSDTTAAADETTEAAAETTGDEETTAAADESQAAEATGDYRIAMITDYGDMTDQSFNQTTYDACKAFCDENGLEFTYYKPDGDSTAERVAMVEKAVDEGYNVIVMPGYAFGETIVETAETYSDITFIALDVAQSDLGDDYVLPSNVYCAVYQEELSGYMAGYAAVKLGYTHLGFLGGMAVPAVERYGYGFIQGVDDAAAELGVEATVEYVYGNQFYGDSDITAYMDNWYQTLGVEVVFACGGGIYTSAAEAAAKVDGCKVIGVDVDQAATIDGDYGDGMTVTSAMKGLAATVNTMLAEVVAGNFASYGGQVDTLGLVSGDDPELNYVQIPMDSTQWSDDFSQDDYLELVSKMYSGEITVSNSTDAMPEVSVTTVNEYGNIK